MYIQITKRTNIIRFLNILPHCKFVKKAGNHNYDRYWQILNIEKKRNKLEGHSLQQPNSYEWSSVFLWDKNNSILATNAPLSMPKLQTVIQFCYIAILFSYDIIWNFDFMDYFRLCGLLNTLKSKLSRFKMLFCESAVSPFLGQYHVHTL